MSGSSVRDSESNATLTTMVSRTDITEPRIVTRPIRRTVGSSRSRRTLGLTHTPSHRGTSTTRVFGCCPLMTVCQRQETCAHPTSVFKRPARQVDSQRMDLWDWLGGLIGWVFELVPP